MVVIGLVITTHILAKNRILGSGADGNDAIMILSNVLNSPLFLLLVLPVVNILVLILFGRYVIFSFGVYPY